MELEVVLDDITKIAVDAIVNAANESLLGGGGVDGAIHRAAGPELLAECRKLNGCSTGQAKITGAYQLPAKYVIHTVGPIYKGSHQGEVNLLRSCYLESMKLADEYHVQKISFPCISTGLYGYPKEDACQIAVDAIRFYQKTYTTSVKQVIFVCFDKESFQLYQKQIQT